MVAVVLHHLSHLKILQVIQLLQQQRLQYLLQVEETHLQLVDVEEDQIILILVLLEMLEDTIQ